MDDNDLASTSDNAEGFTPEEQAAFDAYERGEEIPSASTAAPAADGAPAGGDAAPAAAAPEAAPGEIVDPEADAGSPDENKGKFVRHGAFHQERERRKAVEKELNDLREKYARGDERLKLLNEAMQARPAAAAQPETPLAPPSPDEDIFGYAKHLEKQIEELKNGFTQETTRQRQEREVGEVIRDYQSDLNRFASAEPTFADAFRHVMQSRTAEYAALGVPEAQIQQALQQDEFQIALEARKAGVSPAERIFQIAKARGFAPKAAEPAPAAVPAETPAQKVERVAAGQAGPGKSLSAAGGAPAGEVTFEMLAAMSEKDFEAFATKNPDKLARLMGAEA